MTDRVPPALWHVMAAATLQVAAWSVLNPVLAVRLQRAGYGTRDIGVFAMLSFACIGLAVPLMPRLFARVAVARALRVGIAMQAACAAGFALSAGYATWCGLAVVAGLAAAATWTGTEGLLARHAPASSRGRLLGGYQTAMGVAMAGGPFLPGLVPLPPLAWSWVAAAVLGLALSVELAPSVGRLAIGRADPGREGLLAAWRQAPALAGLAFAGGVFEAGLGTITTAYGAQLGLSLGAAASIAGALGVGSALLQYPAGRVADRWPPGRLFASAGGLLAAVSLAFALVDGRPALLWGCAFGWGAVGGTLYTLSMIRVAQRSRSSSTFAGAAGVITAYTLGGTLGPLVGGWTLDRLGAPGQAAWLTALAIVVIACATRITPERAAA